MLKITNLTYRIAGRTILDSASLTVMNGWKVGIVGANGTGKTTLFKLITDELQADNGDIEKSPKETLGIVKQDIQDSDDSLIDIILQSDLKRADLLARSLTETDPYKIADIHTELNDIDAYSAPSRAASILSGLGFADEEMKQPFSSFSGGWRMRVALASALFLTPDILLLDEPTNHLDLEAIMWLETYIASYPNTVLMISHDRDLLNKCTQHIAHLEDQKFTLYTGNYDSFEKERAEKRGLQQKMHEKQKAHRDHMQTYIDRFRSKASKAKQAQSRIKALEKMDIVDAVIAERATQFVFPNPVQLAPPILSIDDASVGYVENKPILTNITERLDMDDRIALLGANGNGKSTLIKLISGRLKAMSGEVKFPQKLRIGYFSQHQTDELDVNSTPFHEMAKCMVDKKEPQVRSKLGQFGFTKPLSDNAISKLSGGEKARLLFALMSHDAPHILLLDEPTNHLDIDARQALVSALNNYQGAVIIVSHDPSMVERVADQLWIVRNGKVTVFDGDLKAYRKTIAEDRRAERKRRREKKNKEKEIAKVEPLSKEDRKKKHAELKLLKKDVDKFEKVIAKLSQQKEKYEQQMGESDFYQDNKKATEVQNAYNKLAEEISKTEEKWLKIQSEYELAQSE